MSRFSPTLSGRVSRREIALSPHVWFAVAASFGVFAVACLVIGLAIPPFQTTRLLVVAGALGVVAVGVALRPAPEPDSITTHVVIALSYVGTAVAMCGFAPHGSAALGAAVFVAPLTAIWLEDRRQIAAHYAAATVVLLLPSVIGIMDRATFVATCVLLPPSFVLGICCLYVLEGIERQGDGLEDLVMRDPLTGVGNRRMLEERLAVEVARHASSRRPVSLIALDLDGFKQINDTLGHAAGDRLLGEVAAMITAGVGSHATVVRQGGDEFCVILPGTDGAGAAYVGRELAASLAELIPAGIGVATFPEEATEPARLVELADARLIASKEGRRAAAEGASVISERLRRILEGDRPSDAQHGPATVGWTGSEPITRTALSDSPLIWRTTGLMFFFYVAAGIATLIWAPDLSGPLFPVFVAGGAVVGTVILATPPARAGTWQSHLVVAASYVFPALAIVACQPGGSVALGAAIFIGPLAAVRSSQRRDVAAHVGAAIAIFGAIAVSGLIDVASIIGVLLFIGALFVLSVCCVVVFEAAEAQGAELERLAVVDPLTGLANRRQLEVAMEQMLGEARGGSLGAAVLLLDLDGFKALNDTAGHAAGDELLIAVGEQLRRVVGPGAVVGRPGGDEFTVLLPGVTPAGAAGVEADIRAVIDRMSWHGHAIGAGIGAASFPADGADAERLLACADRRLLLDKYGAATEAA